jgi:cellulose synthase/poly-beta-1,6-N-acetylglucosamine synthase-like glycosyltransferase
MLLLRSAVDRLSESYPDLSARRVATGFQAIAGVFVLIAVVVAAIVDAMLTLIVINLFGAALFFGVSALRFVAAGFAGQRKAIAMLPPDFSDDDLPVYSVLVPLYKEAAMVDGLFAALSEIQWPRDRLDIKFLLEEGDDATIAAVRRSVGEQGAPYEVLVVPKGGPQTKPKALSYALPLVRGELVTVYDAEDRPHPLQLREAFATFMEAGSDLACVQSSLLIDNGDDGWLARSFAVEYAALFDGLLPALERLGMPLPLGGTSNHFRGIR